jgi:hypothetical protein
LAEPTVIVQVMDRLDRVMQEVQGIYALIAQAIDGTEAPAPPLPPASLHMVEGSRPRARYSPWPDAILQAFRQGHRPLRIGEVRQALAAMGKPCSYRTASTHVRQLEAAQQLIALPHGYYALPTLGQAVGE